MIRHKDIGFQGAAGLKRCLACISDTLEDRAAAIGALDRSDHLPGLFVRKADAQLALHLRDHVAVNLVGSAAAILDNAGKSSAGSKRNALAGPAMASTIR